MIRPRIQIFAAVCAVAIFSQSPAPSAEPPPVAQILERARVTAAVQQGALAGHLSDGRRRVPLTLEMANKRMRFSFADPVQIISLDLGGNEFRFFEDLGQGERAVPGARYGERLRGTEITYEDLALRFLFWNGELLGEEKIKSRPAWKVRMNNPRREGPYGVVLAWIDQQSSALMRVQGYDWEGRCIKQFEIVSVMSVGEAWMIKEMRVETLDGKGKVTGRTWLHFDEPRRGGGGRRPDL